jgi:8-oxo-dGTP pyrophosphatase MutT (NUDIX family)
LESSLDRRVLLDWLDRYGKRYPEEAENVERVEALVRERRDCFDRTCLPGHITASAWIVSSDHHRFLLTHHRKLNRWLQLGGHTDGDSDVRAAALREAREESGIGEFEVLLDDLELPLIDVDIHPIPAIGDEPHHDHYDMRFLLVAQRDASLRISPESHDLRWFEHALLEELIDETSLLRLGRKARSALARLRR